MLLSPVEHEVQVPAVTSPSYFCRASSDTNLGGIPIGRGTQHIEVKMRSASSHPDNMTNAGVRKKSKEHGLSLQIVKIKWMQMM